MSQAVAQADQLTASKAETGVAQARSARSLLAAAETLEDTPDWQLATVLLLRQAAVLAGRAIVARRKQELDSADLGAVWQSVMQQPELHSLVQGTADELRENVLRLVSTGITETQCTWSPLELRELKEALLPLVHRLVRLLDADIKVAERVRTRRLIRWLATTVALALLTVFGYVAAKEPESTQNLARGALVTDCGTFRPEVYNSKGLVDGDKSILGCHTVVSERPWVMLDLGQPRTIRRVVVTNRGDADLSQLAVPLLIETSRDGTTFERFAHQDKDFKTWTAKGPATTARYVRLSVERRSVVHLNEVEVY